MRKINEVLRLRFELGLGQRQIARSCAIGLSTVHDYLERAATAATSWPLPAGLNEQELEAKLFGHQPVAAKAAPERPQRIGRRFTSNCSNIVISLCSLAVAVGGVSASSSRRLSLQLVLRTLPALATAPGCGAAPGTQGWREDVHRLGERDHSRLRRQHGRSVARVLVCGGAGLQWARATVNIDYHVAFDGNFYSVPYTLVQQVVEVCSTPTTVEIFHQGNRVASHARSRDRGKMITQHEHRPKSHQAHLEWPPSRMVNWARTISPHTAELFERILSEKPHPEMGYSSCLGLTGIPSGPPRSRSAADRNGKTRSRYRRISLTSKLKATSK